MTNVALVSIWTLEICIASITVQAEVLQLSQNELIDFFTDDHIICFACRTDMRLFLSGIVAAGTLHFVASDALNRVNKNVCWVIRTS